jgi:alkylation response protein AidB-like acyl-CoA dehydrogenase
LAQNGGFAPPERSVTWVQDARPFREWQRRLHAAGLVGITWPKEYGGEGLGPAEAAVFASELARAGVPGPFDMVGVSAVGPTIMAHGSEAHKARYLPEILPGREVWCQLFTEPGSGCDLASVRTRAVRTASGWEVTGTKVWTTHGHQAELGLLLARTDQRVPKHQGLTVFAIPMRDPGVSVRPLRQMAGYRDFNEIGIDHVRVAEDAVLGSVGGGWPVALTMLRQERVHLVSGLDQLGFSLDALADAVASAVVAAAPMQRYQAAYVLADLLAVRYTGHRALSALAHGKAPDPAVGLGKITLVDAVMRACRLLVDLGGPSELTGRWGELLAYMPALSLGGGTPEILRSTVGEQGLGLPREPSRDKAVPFYELESALEGTGGR